MIKPRIIRWTGHMACMEKKINAHRMLGGKPEDQRPL
jgi:hypothetical protein